MKPEQFHAALQNLIIDMDDPFADDPAEVISVTEVCDYLMGQVIQGLIEEGKEETAAMMLSCRLDLEVKEQRSGSSLEALTKMPKRVKTGYGKRTGSR